MLKVLGKYVDSSGKRWFWISDPNGSEKSFAGCFMTYGNCSFDIANETAYTMDSMEGCAGTLDT